MLNQEFTPLQYYILGWLYAKKYTIVKCHILLALESNEEFEHFTRITRDNNNYYILSKEPGLIESLISTRFIPSTLYIYDIPVLKNLDVVFDTKLFKRGYFDAIGIVEFKNYITCVISDSKKTDAVFKDDIYRASFINDAKWVWDENDALNFICDLYNVVNNSIPDDDCYLESNLTIIDDAKQIDLEEIPKFIYHKIKDNAVSPSKDLVTQPGFNISVCEKINEIDGIHYYSTGLCFSCEYGYYLEVYGEQLYKLGYMLANPFDVIKPNQTDELIIPLIKLNPNVVDLQLPCHVANVIPKKLNFVEFCELIPS